MLERPLALVGLMASAVLVALAGLVLVVLAAVVVVTLRFTRVALHCAGSATRACIQRAMSARGNAYISARPLQSERKTKRAFPPRINTIASDKKPKILLRARRSRRVVACAQAQRVQNCVARVATTLLWKAKQNKPCTRAVRNRGLTKPEKPPP